MKPAEAPKPTKAPPPTKSAKQPPFDPELLAAMQPVVTPPRERPSEAEIAAAMAPIVREPPPPPEPPAPMKPPPPAMPETGEAALERLKSAGLVSDGKGDPPPWRQRSRTLRIVEEDGVGGEGRVSEIRLDVGYDAWLMVEAQGPDSAEPWRTVATSSRMGLHSVRSLELVDVDPEG